MNLKASLTIALIILCNFLSNANSLLFKKITLDGIDNSHLSFYRLMKTYTDTVMAYNSENPNSDMRSLLNETTHPEHMNETINILAELGDDIVTYITTIFENPYKGYIDEISFGLENETTFDQKQAAKLLQSFVKKLGTLKHEKVMRYFFGPKVSKNELIKRLSLYYQRFAEVKLNMDELPSYLLTKDQRYYRSDVISDHIRIVKQTDDSNIALNSEDLLEDECITGMARNKNLEYKSYKDFFLRSLSLKKEDYRKPAKLLEHQMSYVKNDLLKSIARPLLSCYEMKKENINDLLALIQLVLKDQDDDKKAASAGIKGAIAVNSYCDSLKSVDDSSLNEVQKQSHKEQETACTNVSKYMRQLSTLLTYDLKAEIKKYEDMLNTSNLRNTTVKGTSFDSYYKQYKSLFDTLKKIGFLSEKKKILKKETNETIIKLLEKKITRNKAKHKNEINEIIIKLNNMSQNIIVAFLKSNDPKLSNVKVLGDKMESAFAKPILELLKKSPAEKRIHNILYGFLDSFEANYLNGTSGFDYPLIEGKEVSNDLCKMYKESTIKQIGRALLQAQETESTITEKETKEEFQNLISLLKVVVYPNTRIKRPNKVSQKFKNIVNEIYSVISSAVEKNNLLYKNLNIKSEDVNWSTRNVNLHYDNQRKMEDFDNNENPFHTGCWYKPGNVNRSLICSGSSKKRILATLHALNRTGFGERNSELDLSSTPIRILPAFLHQWSILTLNLKSTLVSFKAQSHKEIPQSVENLEIGDQFLNIDHLVDKDKPSFYSCADGFNDYMNCIRYPEKLKYRQAIGKVSNNMMSKMYKVYDMDSIPSGKADLKPYHSSFEPVDLSWIRKTNVKELKLSNVVYYMFSDTPSLKLRSLIDSGIRTFTDTDFFCYQRMRIYIDGKSIWNDKTCICNPNVTGFEDDAENVGVNEIFKEFLLFCKVYARKIIQSILIFLLCMFMVHILGYKPPDLPCEYQHYMKGSYENDYLEFVKCEYRFQAAKEYVSRKRLNYSDILEFANEKEIDESNKVLYEALAERVHSRMTTGNAK